MSKSSKNADVYIELLRDLRNAEEAILSLPRGYISTKVISGHTYHYLQWREGNQVLSTYVNDALLNSTKQQIVIRKEYEELVKILKKDLKKIEKSLLKAGYTKEEIDSLDENKE